MSSESKNEMEQILRGLEAFLEQEMQDSMPHEGGVQKESEHEDLGQERTEREDTSPEDSGRKNTASEESDGEDIIREDSRWEDSAPEGSDWEEPVPEASGWRNTAPEDSGRTNLEEGPLKWRASNQAESKRKASKQAAAKEEIIDWDAPDRTDSSGKPVKPEMEKGVVQVQKDRTQASKPAGTDKKKGSTGEEKAGKKRRKKSGFRKFLIAVVLIIALLGIGLYQLVGAAYKRINFKEIASVSEEPLQEDGVVNILLIGNDSRENGDDGRSDAMILLSISSRTKTISMTSLLRDMYVEIPGHDGNRLNAAYAYGGAELLMETIEKNFDISVNRYVLVNFEAFASLVDAVGGIELELTSEEIVYVNGYLVEYNMLTGRPQGTDDMDTSLSGLVHLNGPQALAYSRNRYLGTDFGRTERQRKVLTAVIKKLPTALLTNGEGLMNGLLPNLTTNLTKNECFRLSLMAGKLPFYEITSDNIPRPGTYKNVVIRKMEVLEVDFDANIQYLKNKIYGEGGGVSGAE